MTIDEFRQQMESYRQAREQNPQLSYWQFKADLQNVINRINENSNANFVQRLQDYNRQTIPDWEIKGNVATHKLSYATDDFDNAIVYPNVQNINGQLYDFTNPKYNHGEWDSLDRAINTKDTIRMSPYEAQIFTQNYKQYYPKFDEGTNSDGVQNDLNFWERVVNNAKLLKDRYKTFSAITENVKDAIIRNPWQQIFGNTQSNDDVGDTYNAVGAILSRMQASIDKHKLPTVIGDIRPFGIKAKALRRFNGGHYARFENNKLLSALTGGLSAWEYNNGQTSGAIQIDPENDKYYLVKLTDAYTFDDNNANDAYAASLNPIRKFLGKVGRKDGDPKATKQEFYYRIPRFGNDTVRTRAVYPEDYIFGNPDKNELKRIKSLFEVQSHKEGTDENGIQFQTNQELTTEQKQNLDKYLFELQRRSGAIQPAFTIEDAAGFTPIANIQDGYDIYDNIINNNYLTAAGLFGAALIPKFIGKYIKRPIERFAKQAQAKLNSYLTGEKPAVYNLLFSNEQQNVKDNINEALSAYAEYLNNPTVRNRIIESGASDYLPAIDDFTNRVNNNSLALRFPAIDTNDAAAVPHNPDYGDILFYDDYVSNAAKPYVNNQIFDIPQHEASHLIERSVNPEDLTTVYNRFLADYGNMKSFDEWFDEGITNNSLPDWILPKGAKYNSFSKEGRDEIKQKAKDYYKYIYNPSEIHSYLGEATRNAWYNSDVLSDKLDLFPYRNLKELENSFTNPNAKQILNLYKDKKRLFRNLKNNLWLGIPAITTYNLLQTDEEKSN